jgi:hypothetical protein
MRTLPETLGARGNSGEGWRVSRQSCGEASATPHSD